MTVEVRQGDCLDVMRAMAADGVRVDSVVTDPPYHLQSIVKRFAKSGRTDSTRTTSGPHQRTANGFMGQQWDGGDIAFRPEVWELALALLKPGGYLFAFGGTRTYHRMACAIEDAGFIVRDQFGWAYGSGFPKSHDIAKAIDRAAGAERKIVGRKHDADKRTSGGKHEGWQRPWMDDAGAVLRHQSITAPATTEAAQWDGWGTAVKPAWEPVCLAQKPIEGTFAANVLKYGVGGLHIDACRIAGPKPDTTRGAGGQNGRFGPIAAQGRILDDGLGRFPANLVHDGSDEVLACFPHAPGYQRAVGPEHGKKSSVNVYGDYGPREDFPPRGDSGSAARFFYTAKADQTDRWGSKHPTVKPVDLIRWLARLVTPKGGTILDPFAGSGTLGVAAIAEGFNVILIEREADYVADIRERLAFYQGGARHSLASKHRKAAPAKTGESPLMDYLERTAP